MRHIFIVKPKLILIEIHRVSPLILHLFEWPAFYFLPGTVHVRSSHTQQESGILIFPAELFIPYA